MSRTPFVAGNWKMNGTGAQARDFIAELERRLGDDVGVDVAVCLPFTALAPAVEAAAGSRVAIYAQNMHEAGEGAFTGEVSAGMLTAVGVEGVILGHSERRRHFGETDRAVGHKLAAAFAAGLHPILCVGESEEERERGDTERKLRGQVQEALRDVPPGRVGELVVAYEPVWAIGTGQTASPEQAQDAIAFIRAVVEDRVPGTRDTVRVLYGGSVKAENVADLLVGPDVDGALVGGASLDAEAFLAIVQAARP